MSNTDEFEEITPAEEDRPVTEDGQTNESKPAEGVRTVTEEEILPDEIFESTEKKRKPLTVSLFLAIIAALFAALLAAQITFVSVKRNFDVKLASVQKISADNLEAAKKDYEEKLGTVQSSEYLNKKLGILDGIYRSNYINEIDDKQLADGLVEGYIYGAGDKYGNYMTAEEYQEYIKTLNAQMDGIGVSVIWDADLKALEVITVYEGSPAEKAGLQPGDFITAADGKQSSDLGYEQTVASIRGESGTTVEIEVISNGEKKTVSVQRAPIEIKTVKYYNIDNIGVIAISNFYSDTPDELKAAVNALKDKGCDRLIFDMRNNPGGLLDAVVSALDYLLPEGVLVRTVDAKGNETKYPSDADCIDMPMTVIVNGSTASAAELFTSALMDFDYAEVVGTTTYGKGTVTAPYMLGDGSVVYISMMLYYPPVSDNFEGKGITPDVEIELSEEAQKINFNKLTYENDNQLQKAVEIIKNK